MAARYQFRQDDWSYGMSSDDIGGRGTVYRADNVDTLTDKTSFTVGPNINDEYTQDTGSDALVSANIASNTRQIWCGDVHTIYGFNLASAKVLTNTTNADRICNSGVVSSDTGSSLGFLLQRGYISKWTYDGTDSTVGISFLSERTATFTPVGNDTFKRPYYVEANRIFFGAGSDVLTANAISTSISMDTEKLTVGRGQTIVAISKIGDQFIVYASDGSAGYQYFWDGTSTDPNRVIRWAGLNITNAASLGNYDYVTCLDAAGRSFLYRSTGYSRQLVRQSGYYDSPVSARFSFDSSYTNAIETLGETVLIPSNSFENGGGGLYSVGKYHDNYPISITRPFFYSTGGYVTCIYSDTSSGSGYDVYFSTQSGYTKKVRRFFKPFGNYYSNLEGSVETNRIVGQFGESQKKTAVKYRVGYNLPANANSYVKVYYRKDGETSYTLHSTVQGTATAQRGSETFNMGLDFYSIQFKICIYSGSYTNTPRIMDFTLEYEPISNALGN